MSQPSTDVYVTAEIRRLIGTSGRRVCAPEPVDLSSIRRMAQAIMDDDPLYWDESYARGTRYGGIVAPPLFPLHACRREPGSPDPLDRAIADPDFDGVGDVMARAGLPELDIGLPRLLNGGNDVTIYELARVGDRITATSTIADIQEKHGRSGPFVLVVVETLYEAENRKAPLLRSRQTHILR